MASIHKPLIKILLISLTFTAGIGFSVFSTVTQSLANQNVPSKKINNTYGYSTAQHTYKPRSEYNKKLQRSINRSIYKII
jgi:hypothetical protein